MLPSNLTLTKPLQMVIWSSVAVETRGTVCSGFGIVGSGPVVVWLLGVFFK